jgi:hypothetical protein
VRAYPLSVLQGGINRLRVKGNAAANSLYDLRNAYITNAGSIVPREGTQIATQLDSSTVGLAAANGTFNIFSSQYSTATLGSNFVLNVLSNPVNTSSSPQIIWFAKPFMGFLYVVAQFTDSTVHHYWLQNDGTWTSNTDYTSASIVLPPTANGLAYQGVRDFPPNPLWTANTTVTSGSYIEPNTATGFCYQAIAVTGSPVHTGLSEPVWPTVAGGIVQEFGDFDASSTDAGTTQGSSVFSTAAALGSTLTDRYGDSATIANSGIFATSSTLSTLTLASTKVTTWKAGTAYAPGAVVVPTTNQGAYINAIPNGDFEGGSGAGGWTFSDPGGSLLWAYSSVNPYQGTECIAFPSGAGIGSTGSYATMTSYSLVKPGQSVTAQAYLDPNNAGANLTLWIQLNWYDSSDTLISTTGSQQNEQEGGGYRLTSVTGTAPATAAHCRVAIGAGSGTSSRNPGYADLVTWNLSQAAAVSNFLYEAVQANPGVSASTEPTWPTSLSAEVIDNTVTWQAIGTSIITWQAIPLMQSGANAPTFPTTIGNSVRDSSSYKNQNGYITTFCSMSWECIDRHILDTNCPNTIPTCLGASHVFNGSNDIVPFSAAVNPTDWTSTNNAGYLPTGLNNYGDNPVAVLALYRSNLMAFNAGGYQMWQIDPDPQNMALLDAQPIGSMYPRAVQSVANDLLFVAEVGVRNIGTVGATANMAIGNTGQPVDPIVVGLLSTASTGYPLSIYYPARGQYWLIFGTDAMVLTINGGGNKTWSHYTFPDVITDATLNEGYLYFRTSLGYVWQLNQTAVGVDGIVASGSGIYDANTLMLLHFDGTAGSTVFTDSSQNNFAITVPGAGPQLETTTVKIGTAALQLANGGINSPVISAGSVLDLSTENWTIEFWTYATTYPSVGATYGIAGFGNSTATNGGVGILMLHDGTIQFQYYQGGSSYSQLNSTQITTGTWHNIAFVRNGSNFIGFVDGVPYPYVTTFSGSLNASLSNSGTSTVSVGQCPLDSTPYVNSYVDEFRLSNVARYVTTYTPSTVAFSPYLISAGLSAFNGIIQWPYLDMGNMGINKMMTGVDIVGDGVCSVQIGWDQTNKTTFSDSATFTSSTGITAPYTISLADTIPGEPLVIPLNAPSVSLCLTFPGSITTPNAWTWEAANLYVTDQKGAGATG